MSAAATIRRINTNATTTAQDVQKAWKEYQSVEKRGIEFGHVLFSYRDSHKSTGGAGSTGKGLVQLLHELSIPKSTAYYWIHRHEEYVGLRKVVIKERWDNDFFDLPPQAIAAGRKTWTEEQVFDWLKEKHPAVYAHYEAKGFPRWIPLPPSVETTDKASCEYCIFHSSSRSCPIHGWTEKRDHARENATAASAAPYEHPVVAWLKTATWERNPPTITELVKAGNRAGFTDKEVAGAAKILGFQPAMNRQSYSDRLLTEPSKEMLQSAKDVDIYAAGMKALAEQALETTVAPAITSAVFCCPNCSVSLESKSALKRHGRYDHGILPTAMASFVNGTKVPTYQENPFDLTALFSSMDVQVKPVSAEMQGDAGRFHILIRNRTADEIRTIAGLLKAYLENQNG